MRSLRVLAWCGVAGPVIRLSLILVLGVLNPAYSQARDFISELGAEGAPGAWVMNYFGISLVGLLLVLFSVALYRAYRPGAHVAAGATFLGLSGLAFVAVGLFPCGPGCALVDTPAMRIHLAAGAVGMTAQTLAVAAFGVRALVHPVPRLRAATSVGLGLVALVALVLFLGWGFRVPYPGLVQKTVQLATDVWVLVMAALILSEQARASSTPGPPGAGARGAAPAGAGPTT